MESILPAIAFAALIIAQFAAVVAVQIHFPDGFSLRLPPLTSGTPLAQHFSGAKKEESGDAFYKRT